MVSTADSGRPAPSVLDRVSTSGTTPSRSMANIVPVRPSPVCASSTTSSIPRRRQCSARAVEVARREVEHPAGAEDRLRDEGREAPRGLPVDQVEGVVELGPPVVAAGRAERPAARVRRRDREGADALGAVAAPAEGVGRRGRSPGDAVPALGEGDDLVPAGDELRQAQRRLVRLGAGAEEHDPVQRRRSERGEPLRPARAPARTASPSAGGRAAPPTASTAATTSGWQCPRIELSCPEVKSRTARPLAS